MSPLNKVEKRLKSPDFQANPPIQGDRQWQDFKLRWLTIDTENLSIVIGREN